MSKKQLLATARKSPKVAMFIITGKRLTLSLLAKEAEKAGFKG